jgi:hypothetical protein
VWILIAAVLLTSAPDTDVSVAKLDGSTFSGKIESWADGALVVDTTAGQERVAESDLLWIKRAAPSIEQDTGVAKPAVAFSDGSVLPLEKYTTDGNKSQIALHFDEQAKFAPTIVPTQKVHWVRLKALNKVAAEQWNDVLSTSAPSDLLVVLKREGQSLDYLEGVIGQVTDQDVEFTRDGETVHVGRDKLAGVVFYRKTPTSTDESAHCVVSGTDGLTIRCTQVTLAGGELQIVTSLGVALHWPWADVASADFSAGKLTFLSDLKPVLQSWQPLIALPKAVEHAASFGQPRLDHAAFGGPLSLWYPEGDNNSGSGHIEAFAKGLAIRSRTEVVYRLPEGFNRFMAVVGIEPATRSNGNVLLSILGDDHPLLERNVSGIDAPQPIDINISGIKQLRLVVDYGKNLDTGDWLNLCNARIIK